MAMIFEILSMFYQLLHILVKKYRKLDVQDELLKSNQQLNRLSMITSISEGSLYGRYFA